MAYVPQSSNPFVTTQMLREALYTVSIQRGPEKVQDIIKKRIGFQLVMDNSRKKLLAHCINGEIIWEIDYVDIDSVVCLDAKQIKQDRHRVLLNTKNKESYLFYIEIPYQHDPLPFLYKLNRQIKFAQDPKAEETNNKASTVVAIIGAIVFAICTMANWASGDNIGWGIITLALSAVCVMGFMSLKNDNKTNHKK